MPEVHRARWADLDPRTLHDLVRLRVDVFVVEQHCAYPELDGRDVEPGTEHWWTADADGPTSYLRVLTEPDGTRRIGRVATRADARGRGLGGLLMDGVLTAHGDLGLVLDAQVYIQEFYAARGFTVVGDEYLDDGIPHVPMWRPPGSADAVLPRSSPRTQGVDSRGVGRFLDAVEARAGVEMHSVMVLRHGCVVAEGWWAPYTAHRPHLLYSLSKSFTSAALGLAVAEGLVSLDDTLLQHLPELAGDDVAHDPSLRHLASMASGHRRDTWHEVAAADPREPLRAFVRLPPDGEPGTTFAYNQPCTYAVAAVLQRRAGTPLTGYLRNRLLDPVGIGEVRWDQHPAGRDLGFTGLHARTEDVARLGLLHLQRGRWGERQVLPPEWVDAATTAQVATGGEGNPDWAQGYGYQFWAARHGYRGDGAFGQFCVVLPEHDAVVAVTGASTDLQAVLDAMWQHLLPALGGDPLDGPDAEQADDALAARLAHLGLPHRPGAPAPQDRQRWDRVLFHVQDGGDDAVPLRGVRVAHDGGRWRLQLEEDEGSVVADLPTDGGWRTTEHASTAAVVPVAVAGGWQPGGSLDLRVAFLETPHSVDVHVDPDRGTAEVRWVTEPLRRTALTRLAAPRGVTRSDVVGHAEEPVAPNG